MTNGKAVGPYSIPIFLLEILSEHIATTLRDIINDSFSNGKFPDMMNLAKVIPLYEKTSTDNPSNYVPISLLSVFSKITKKLIHTRLYNFLEQHNVLYSLQFGFRGKNSTLHALISLTESIKKQLMMVCMVVEYLSTCKKRLTLSNTQFC